MMEKTFLKIAGLGVFLCFVSSLDRLFRLTATFLAVAAAVVTFNLHVPLQNRIQLQIEISEKLLGVFT